VTRYETALRSLVDKVDKDNDLERQIASRNKEFGSNCLPG
jgi:hypothetical protein